MSQNRGDDSNRNSRENHDIVFKRGGFLAKKDNFWPTNPATDNTPYI